MRLLAVVTLLLFLAAAAAAQAPGAGQVIQLVRSTKLPVPTQMHGSAVVGGRLYALGGNANGPWTDKVYSAQLLGDGRVGDWRAERQMPERRCYIGGSTGSAGRCIYVVAGSAPDTPSSSEAQLMTMKRKTILWAPVAEDGALSEWKTSKPYDGDGVSCAASCFSDRFVVLTGGSLGEKLSDRMLIADLGADGSPGGWRDAGRLPRPLWWHCAAMAEERIYIWGGLTSKDNKDVNRQVFSAPLAQDGQPGPWREETALPSPVYGSAFCGFNDHLVSIGGRYEAGYPTNVVWYARLAEGRVGDWHVVNTDLDSRMYHDLGLDQTNGVVYIVGGRHKTLPVEKGTILDTVQVFRLSQPSASRLDLAVPGQAGSAKAGGTIASPAPSIEQGLALASSSGRDLLVFFYSPEVPACRRVWDNVIAQPGFADASSRYAFAAVNITQCDQKLLYQHSVYKVPCLAVFTASGRLRHRSQDIDSLEKAKAFLLAAAGKAGAP